MNILLAVLSSMPLLVIEPHLALVLLAVVQGLTEFLPVSSSGHLVLVQQVLGFGKGSILDDVVLHVGTLAAVMYFYRRDILRLIVDLPRRTEEAAGSRRYVLYLILANVPAAALGLSAKDQLERVFERVSLVLIALAVTAGVLFATRFVRRGNAPITAKVALLIGVAQAVAILPGCSRSGWTIATALILGVGTVEAARFSFLISVPAILGATLLELRGAEGLTAPPSALLLGVVISAVVGFFALRWLVRLVEDMALHRFAWYLVAVVAAGSWFFSRAG